MLREMSLTRRIRYEIEAREKARRDRVAEIQYLQEEAMEQGLEQGQETMKSLYANLLEDNRVEDMKRAIKDEEYLRGLMDEYHIK